MLQNHKADSWDEATQTPVYDDETVPNLDRLQAYVDHCFEEYAVVSDHLNREQVQCCVADWDRRRGQARPNKKPSKRVFGKRVLNKHFTRHDNRHVLFVAKALIGQPPENDKGVGWKACVRHELGHIIDYARRGRSGHDSAFKHIMALFGEEVNDGQHSHGYRPDVFK